MLKIELYLDVKSYTNNFVIQFFNLAYNGVATWEHLEHVLPLKN